MVLAKKIVYLSDFLLIYFITINNSYGSYLTDCLEYGKIHSNLK